MYLVFAFLISILHTVALKKKSPDLSPKGAENVFSTKDVESIHDYFRGRPTAEMNDGRKSVMEGQRNFEDAQKKLADKAEKLKKWHAQVTEEVKNALQEDYLAFKDIQGVIDENKKFLNDVKTGPEIIEKDFTTGMKSSSRGRFEMIDSNAESNGVIHTSPSLQPSSAIEETANQQQSNAQFPTDFGKGFGKGFGKFKGKKKIGAAAKANALAAATKKYYVGKTDFLGFAQYYSKKVKKPMTAARVKLIFAAALRRGLDGTSKMVRLTEPKVMAKGAGGCLGMLTHFGFAKSFTEGAKSKGIVGVAGVGAGAWHSAAAIKTKSKHDGNCYLLKLGDTRAEIADKLMSCLGCEGMSFKECNNLPNMTEQISKVFGYDQQYCVDSLKSHDWHSAKKYLKSFDKFCTAETGCNLQNSQKYLTHTVLNGDCSYTLKDSDSVYLISGAERKNHRGRRGVEYLKKQRVPLIWNFNQKFPTSASGRQKKMYANEWCDAVSFASNSMVTTLMDTCWVLESNLCAIPIGNRSAAKVFAKNVTSILMAMSKQNPLQPKAASLFERAILEASMNRSDTDSKFSLPSPCLSMLWSMLPHEDIPGSSYISQSTNLLNPIMTDASTIDPAAMLTAVAFMDNAIWNRTNYRLMAFDTAMDPYSWFKGGKVKETDLFYSATKLMYDAGIACDTSTMVDSPNGFFGPLGISTVEDEFFSVWPEFVKYLYGTTTTDQLMPDWMVNLLLHFDGKVNANPYWGIKGGWKTKVGYTSMAPSFIDKFLLDMLPDDFQDELLAMGYPDLSTRTSTEELGDMLSVPFFQAFAVRAAGEMRGYFAECLNFYDFNYTTFSTPECAPDGYAYDNPGMLPETISTFLKPYSMEDQYWWLE